MEIPRKYFKFILFRSCGVKWFDIFYRDLYIGNGGGFDFSGQAPNGMFVHPGIGSLAPHSVKNATQLRGNLGNQSVTNGMSAQLSPKNNSNLGNMMHN